MIFSELKIAAYGIAALAIVGSLAGVALVVERHGYDKAVAVLQPKLDKANADIGVLSDAQKTSEATISALRANDAANDALVEKYSADIDDLHQQASDTAAAIRKVQSNDQSVAAYLSTPVPLALRGVYHHGQSAAGNDARAGDKNSGGAAAQAVRH